MEFENCVGVLPSACCNGAGDVTAERGSKSDSNGIISGHVSKVLDLDEIENGQDWRLLERAFEFEVDVDKLAEGRTSRQSYKCTYAAASITVDQIGYSRKSLTFPDIGMESQDTDAQDLVPQVEHAPQDCARFTPRGSIRSAMGTTFSTSVKSPSFQGMDSGELGSILEFARSQGRKREMLIIVPCLSIGLVFMTLGFGLYAFTRANEDVTALRITSWFLPPLGLVCFLAAILPTHSRGLRFAVVMGISSTTTFGLFYCFQAISVSVRVGRHECELNDNQVPCSALTYQLVIDSLRTIVFWSVAVATFWYSRLPARAKLDAMWRLCGVTLGFLGLLGVFEAIQLQVTDWFPQESVSATLVSGLLRLALCIFVLVPEIRTQIQSWLASRGQSLTAAAGIAALLDGAPPKDIVRKASTLFRHVSLTDISKEKMASPDPEPENFSLSKPVRFGDVDAFLSHSWHDNVDFKWSALQRWRNTFKLQHGREPKLWIDKFCINQNNIVDILRCLPVFLAGCDVLLIVAGRTYTQRLWCVFEIFVFLEMGGSIEGIQLLCKDEIKTVIYNFDASKAKCSLAADEDRIKSCIETAFAGMDEFNSRVSEALIAAHFELEYSVNSQPSRSLSEEQPE